MPLPSSAETTPRPAGAAFRGLPAGPYLVQLRRIGYQSSTHTVAVRAGGSDTLEVRGRPASNCP